MAFELREPLSPEDAKRLIRAILDNGTFRLARHAASEFAADDLTTVDCVHALRGGVVGPPEWENGSWRYRVHTGRICVVVAFRSAMALVVVTAWRTSA